MKKLLLLHALIISNCYASDGQFMHDIQKFGHRTLASHTLLNKFGALALNHPASQQNYDLFYNATIRKIEEDVTVLKRLYPNKENLINDLYHIIYSTCAHLSANATDQHINALIANHIKLFS